MTGDISRLHQLLPGAAFFMEHYPAHPDGDGFSKFGSGLRTGMFHNTTNEHLVQLYSFPKVRHPSSRTKSESCLSVWRGGKSAPLWSGRPRTKEATYIYTLDTHTHFEMRRRAGKATCRGECRF